MTNPHRPDAGDERMEARVPVDNFETGAHDDAPVPAEGQAGVADDGLNDADAALDLVWLGDATRGLDEFAPTPPARASRVAPWRPAAPPPAVEPDADGQTIEEPSTTPATAAGPSRLRRVAVPALLVAAGVAVISNLERQAPAVTRAWLASRPLTSASIVAGDPMPAPAVLAFAAAARQRPLRADDGDGRRAPARPSIPPRPPVANAAAAAPPLEAPAAVSSPRRDTATRPPAADEAIETVADEPAPAVALRPIDTPALDADTTPVRRASVLPGDGDTPRPADGGDATPARLAAEAAAPPLAATPAAPRRDLEARAIEQVLGAYRAAFNRRDARAAAAVWPTVDARALARAFDGLADQSVRFDHCQYEIDDDRAEAACRGTTRYVTAVGSRTPRTDPRRWRFRLGRRLGRWTIASVEAR